AMRKKFPHYTIEYIATGKGTTFPEMMAAGTEIDIVWHDVNTTIPQLLEYGLQYDMTELIQKHGLNMTNLEATSMDVAKQMSGGKMYALPLVINTAALYFNKDLFDKFAVAYPKDGMTWDQVIDLAKRMYRQDAGIDYYGIASGTQPQFNLTSMAVPFIDPKTNKPTILTDGRWKTIYQQLIEMRKTMGNKNLVEDHFVKDKNIAMFDYLANTFLNKDMTTMNWDLVTYPTFKELPNQGPQTLPTLFGITSTSKNKDAAMKVLAYMLSEEAQLSLSERAVIPVLQTDKTIKAFGTKSKYEGKNFQAILKLKFTPSAPKSAIENKARTAYAKPVVDLAAEKLDLNTAFRQVDEELNKIIAEEMARLAK
ncbi:MAG: extracellular solute-binding protein family 1, partial [Paenibacillus sp.]|nr:extracellular solute-binding protein family 1 [Paenibacillus sp.]